MFSNSASERFFKAQSTLTVTLKHVKVMQNEAESTAEIAMKTLHDAVTLCDKKVDNGLRKNKLVVSCCCCKMYHIFLSYAMPLPEGCDFLLTG